MPQNLDAVILQLYARAPAPCRDYCGLTITHTDVILNIWNITFGPHVYPKRQKCCMDEMDQNRLFQMEIKQIFGNHVLEYVMSISRNQINLQNLPNKIFHNILKYLAAKDILTLSQTSKFLFERCDADYIWSLLFRKQLKRRPDRQDLHTAKDIGWKETLHRKMILQSSKLIRVKSRTVTESIKNRIQKTIHLADTAIVQKDGGRAVRSDKGKLGSAKSSSNLITTKPASNKTILKPHFETISDFKLAEKFPQILQNKYNKLKSGSKKVAGSK